MLTLPWDPRPNSYLSLAHSSSILPLHCLLRSNLGFLSTFPGLKSFRRFRSDNEKLPET